MKNGGGGAAVMQKEELTLCGDRWCASSGNEVDGLFNKNCNSVFFLFIYPIAN